MVASPSWEDAITIETWPAGMERLFYRRDFHVYRDEKILISAVSYWLALNIETLRPRIFPIDENIIKHNTGRFAIKSVMEKIASPAGGTLQSRKIHYSELDQNKHVNNTKYADWIMDAFEVSRLEQCMPVFFGIEYKHEVKEHDVVQIRHAPDILHENVVLLEGTVAGSNNICFRSKVVF